MKKNDSGLSFAVVLNPSVGSSQDSGTPHSLYSGASIAPCPDHLSRPMRRLKVPGLENMEDGSAPCHTLDERQVIRMHYSNYQ